MVDSIHSTPLEAGTSAQAHYWRGQAARPRNPFDASPERATLANARTCREPPPCELSPSGWACLGGARRPREVLHRHTRPRVRLELMLRVLCLARKLGVANRRSTRPSRRPPTLTSSTKSELDASILVNLRALTMQTLPIEANPPGAPLRLRKHEVRVPHPQRLQQPLLQEGLVRAWGVCSKAIDGSFVRRGRQYRSSRVLTTPLFTALVTDDLVTTVRRQGPLECRVYSCFPPPWAGRMVATPNTATLPSTNDCTSDTTCATLTTSARRPASLA